MSKLYWTTNTIQDGTFLKMSITNQELAVVSSASVLRLHTCNILSKTRFLHLSFTFVEKRVKHGTLLFSFIIQIPKILSLDTVMLPNLSLNLKRAPDRYLLWKLLFLISWCWSKKMHHSGLLTICLEQVILWNLLRDHIRAASIPGMKIQRRLISGTFCWLNLAWLNQETKLGNANWIDAFYRWSIYCVRRANREYSSHKGIPVVKFFSLSQN